MHELTSAAVALMVCVAAGSYLAGCCNGAIITSFLFYHDDIRKHGSHIRRVKFRLRRPGALL